MGWKTARKIATIALLITLTLSACQQFSLFDELGGSVKGSDGVVTIAPATIEIIAGGTLTFTAAGGIPPYVFSVASGLGVIDSATGSFVASVTPGDVTIEVTDAVGQTAQAVATVVSVAGPLFISPATISINPGNALTFIAGGGTGPYFFDIPINNSGAPAILPADSGNYVAGPSTGGDQVRVTDSSLPVAQEVFANITVTSAATNVDYDIDELSPVFVMPAVVTAGNPVSGLDFTITNIGTANGSYDVSWMVYLSADGVLGAGDYLIDQGTIGRLDAGVECTDAEINPGGTWPFVEGAHTVFVRISAADDLDLPNDTTSSPITVNPRDIDYTVTINSFPATANAGGDASGMIDIDIYNIGADDGAATVYWTAWMSLGDFDHADAGDIVLSAGTIPGIAGASSTNVSLINALWPTIADSDWRIVVDVEAADEQAGATGNNLGFDGPIDIQVADINYDITLLNEPPAGERVAGRTYTGDFDVWNLGTVNGTADLHWVAYISADTALDEALDQAFDSGNIAGGLFAGTSTNATYSGTWPIVGSSYYILIDLISGEDNNAGDDLEASSLISTTEADVDYFSSNISYPATANAGGDASGQIDFDIENSGMDDGVATVFWTAWMSMGDNDIVDPGDVIIGSGSIPALTSSGSANVIVNNAVWPSTINVDWRIVIEVQADDEPIAAIANNQDFIGPVSVEEADIDYEVTFVGIPAINETLAGRSFSAVFQVTNVGSVDGSTDVTWVAYISANPTLEIGTDDPIDSGIVAGGLISAGSSTPMYGGVWPSLPGNHYLIVNVISSEDSQNGNDVNVSPMVATTAPDINYAVSAVNAPPSGVTGGDASGLIDFTINNVGSDDGLETVRWTMWMSMADTDILDVNDVMIGSGTIGPLLGTGSQIVGPVSNIQWPAVSAADWNVIVFVEADDDLLSGDFNSDGPVDLAYADIDYVVTTVIEPPPPERLAGRPFSGSFDVSNLGSDNGTVDFQWIAYYSDRTPAPLPIVDLADTAFDSGIESWIPGLGTDAGITYSGVWPDTPVPEDYQILIKVITTEDQNLGNNENESVVVSVTEANVDYIVPGVSMSTPHVPGSPLLESFTLDNIGADDGNKFVYWTAHMSLGDTDNDDAGDVLIDSGVEASMDIIEPPRPVTINGLWPSTTGATWYLVVEAVAADDVNLVNNEQSAGMITIANADVDYFVESFNPPLAPDLRTDRSFSNTFNIKNNGSDAGIADATWYLYISDNATLEEGTDVVFASGTQSALGAGAPGPGINYSGVWPSLPNSYFIISKVESSEDINLVNNVQIWGSWAVVQPNVDYQIASVNNLGSTTAGDPLSAQFEYRNNGTDSGLLPVNWVAVISNDAAYDPGIDAVIDAGTEPALAGGANDAGNLIDSTWPSAPGTYWIIVTVDSSDETGPSPDWTASSNITINPRQVDYRPDPGSIVITGPVDPLQYHPGSAFAGQFTFSHLMPDDGQALLNWAVYLSVDGSLDGGDILVDSDVGLPPLSAFATSGNVTFNGTWPLTQGDYRLIVNISAADDISVANDSQVGGPTYNMGNFYNEDAFEPNDDFFLLVDVYRPGIRFQPGMSVFMSGNLESDGDDVIEFDTGSATSLTFSMVWAGSHDVDMFIFDNVPAVLDGIGITNVTALSMTWIVDSPDTLRWFDIDNAKVPALGAYTLVITAQ